MTARSNFASSTVALSGSNAPHINAAPYESQAELTARLESLAHDDALALLGDLAGALFPSGTGDLHQLTWEATTTPPAVPAASAASSPSDQHALDQARLKAAELRYRTLVEQIPAVTFMAVLGEGENEVYVSPHIEALLGFTQKEWLENPFLWYTQLHPDDRALWLDEFARGCRTGGPFRAECRLIARDGRIVWVRGEARLIKDELGRPLFLQGVAFDITESKLTHERVLRQAVRRTEERYRDLVEQLGAIFWEAEPRSGRFSFVSRGAERILGFPTSRWVDDPGFWITLVHPEDRARVVAVWQHALAQTQDGEFEFRAITADNRVVWLHNSIHFPLADAGDARPLGVILDVTERKRAEEQLAHMLRSEQLARAEAEALNRVGRSVAAELDLEQLVKQIADVGAELTGAEWAAFCRLSDRGETCEAYVRHGHGGASARHVHCPIDDPLLAVTLAGVTDLVEDLGRRGQAGARNALFAGAQLRSYLGVPVISRSGDVVGALLFGHSQPGRFTTRHERLVEAFATQTAIAVDNARLYDAAESARRAAEAANRVKDEFLATMSHELRTPVNAVLGWSNILEVGAGGDEMRERALLAIKRNARAQAQIIEDLLDVSRIVTGKLRLEITRVDLRSVIDGALETVKLAADAKHIHLSTKIGASSVNVLGDVGRLRQVVSNLLTNAVKFTPQGGRIDVRLDAADRLAVVQVADTGQGIDPDFLPYVFDRFRQGDGSSTRTHGGLGLGLAIVRHLIELHGGRVRADSAGPGQGSTFTIELPLDTVDEADSSRSGGRHGRAGDAASDDIHWLRDAHVLVIDDDQDSVDVLVTMLAHAGALVSSAERVPDALRLLKSRPFDLVVCDIGMPEEDGIALIRQLRASSGPNDRVPAAAVTAYAREEDRQRALVAGFQAFVSKPIDVNEALVVLGHLIAATRV